jgi:hypothetical protein
MRRAPALNIPLSRVPERQPRREASSFTCDHRRGDRLLPFRGAEAEVSARRKRPSYPRAKGGWEARQGRSLYAACHSSKRVKSVR